MSEEDALNRIRYLLYIYKDDITNTYKATGDVFDKDFMAIDKLYNMYLNEVNKSNKRNKIINLMAEYIVKEVPGKKMISCPFMQNNKCNENGCKFCIIKYFKKEVKDE